MDNKVKKKIIEDLIKVQGGQAQATWFIFHNREDDQYTKEELFSIWVNAQGLDKEVEFYNKLLKDLKEGVEL